MNKILELYEKPEDKRAPVICLDEKPFMLREELRAPLPMRSGHPAKRDYEYKRNGSAALHVAVLPKAGQRLASVTKRRTGREFALFMKNIYNKFKHCRTIHLVMDNLNTHTQKSLVRHLGPKLGDRIWRKFTVYYTPVHASWLNMAELELSALSRIAVHRERVPDVATLKARLMPCVRKRNRQKATIQWTFSKNDAKRVFKL